MKKLSILVILTALAVYGFAYEDEKGCTSITVGKQASVDGSVMTTHTCDSRVTRTWIDIVKAKKYKPGAKRKVYVDSNKTASAYDLSKQKEKGEIPQPAETYKYFNTALPPLNGRQVAIGESTFGGKKEMKSDAGVIDYYELNRIMIERAATAREAIAAADEVTKKYGYIEGGECFTIADPKEVWHLEIIGPGKGKKGAVWVAQRVPDGHISVNGNGSRIREIDLSRPDYFMASENYKSRAVELGLYDPAAGKPFEFCYVYASRDSMAARRREWRVFDLLAPSLKLDPNSENYPFSVKPDKKVSVKDIMDIYRDTYEDTPFDMTKNMLVPERDKDDKITGKFIKSPYANPFMDYDMMPLFKINGGWNELGERCIARYYCTYITIIQVRDWLPDDIGGLVWFSYDNPAMAAYAPLYIGIEKVPEPYKICGRPGFNYDCAWWAFNRVADLSAQKWGHMRHDVAKVWRKFEKEALQNQAKVEAEALALYKKNPKKARKFLTGYSNDWMEKLVKAYWQLGNDLWSKYTGKF
ncbi:MAG: C69 family dipeptidase [Candidatus Aminicenantes bacterium]|nr:C69 family dipeptidase [Candidatus Aminicenantes bacterium]